MKPSAQVHAKRHETNAQPSQIIRHYGHGGVAACLSLERVNLGGKRRLVEGREGLWNVGVDLVPSLFDLPYQPEMC